MATLSRRRKLGTIYTKSPAQKVEHWLITNISKIIFAIISGIIWMVIYYVFVGIFRFLSDSLMHWEGYSEITTFQLYMDPKFMWGNMIGVVCVFFFVLRDRLNRR